MVEGKDREEQTWGETRGLEEDFGPEGKGLNDAEILAQFGEMEQATKETSQQPVVLTHKVLHQLQKTLLRPAG